MGARPSTSWNDVQYEISLVAGPVAGAPDNGGPALGSRDGTVLGTPASATLVCATAVLGSNNQDLVYVLVVDTNDPHLGEPFAIRIDVFNALQQDGVPDEGAGGTNYRFTQGNFDNVRLTVQAKTLPVPEPAEEEKVLVNGSFEQPEGGQAGFDGVPGWATDAPAVNSGVQADLNAAEGVQAAYLGGGDPSIWQVSSLVVQEGDVLGLRVVARNAAGAASLQMTLFVDSLGTRVPIATQVVALTDSMAEYVLSVEDASAFVGLVIGVDLANAGAADTSLVLDDVRLE